MNQFVRYFTFFLVGLTLLSVLATAYQTFYVNAFPIEYFDEE